MNKKLKWLIGAAAGLAVVAAMAPWTFSGAAMRNELAQQVRETTGLIAQASGRTTLALLPRPRIKIEDVTIRDRDGKLIIKSAALRGDLRILPAFAGRMEVSSLSLAAPDIDIDLDGKPLSGEGAIARAIEARSETREAASADRARLASVSIHGGTARLTRSGAVVSTLETIEATLDWRSLNTPAGLRATFRWADEPVDVTAWLAQPAQVLRGDSSPVSLRLDSPSLTLNADGIATGGQTPSYAGKFSVEAPSMRDILARNAIYLPLPGALGALALSADARATLRSIQLSELQFRLDATSYEGAVILSNHQGRPALMGTLATRSLEIEPLLAQMPALRDGDGRWNAAALPKPDLARADVDLRISANRARFGRSELRDVGFSVLVAGGKGEVAIAEANAFGGSLKARLSAEPSGSGYLTRASAAFTRVDSAALLGELFRSQRFSGEATGEFSFAGQGASVAEVVGSMRGSARVDLANGDISGIDLENALRRLEKQPLSAASAIRTGRTSYRTGLLDLDVAAGVATIRTLEAKGAGVDVMVTGSAILARRLLDITIKARQAGREDNEPAPQLSMDLRGNWDDPNLVIDAQSLIRRSQAAAPLLRAPAEGGGAANRP
jgi:AsmA protein